MPSVKLLVALLTCSSLWFTSLVTLCVAVYCITVCKRDRIHFIEIHEKEWCPLFIRRAIRHSLHIGWSAFGFGNLIGSPSQTVASVLLETLRCKGSDLPISFIDLCSGSGGPTPDIHATIEQKRKGRTTTVVTDLIPHISQWQRLKSQYSGLTYHPSSVDATRLDTAQLLQSSANAKGGKKELCVRSIYGALHHFKPALAIEMLSDAMVNGDGFIAVECILRRSSLFDFVQFPVLLTLLAPLFLINLIHATLTDRNEESNASGNSTMRKIGESILYIVTTPIWTTAFIFDAAISCARTYSLSQLTDLTKMARMHAQKKVGNPKLIKKYEWRAFEEKAHLTPPLGLFCTLTFLVGMPQ